MWWQISSLIIWWCSSFQITEVIRNTADLESIRAVCVNKYNMSHAPISTGHLTGLDRKVDKQEWVKHDQRIFILHSSLHFHVKKLVEKSCCVVVEETELTYQVIQLQPGHKSSPDTLTYLSMDVMEAVDGALDNVKNVMDNAIQRINKEIKIQKLKSDSLCQLKTAHNWQEEKELVVDKSSPNYFWRAHTITVLLFLISCLIYEGSCQIFAVKC